MTDSIHAAFAAAYQKVENPTRNATANYGTYATLEEVLGRVKSALSEHNLVLVQESMSDENGIGVHTIVYDETGARIDFGSVTLPLAKRDAQAAGSCLTYARRYALKSIFGLAEVDDDGKGACAPEEAAPKNELRDAWEKCRKAMESHPERKEAVAARLGKPKSQSAALAAFCALSEADRVAVWTLANGGEVS